MGLAYVPIQPDAPIKRTESIKNMTKCRTVLNSDMQIPKCEKNFIPAPVDANNCVYVIFTSGSTGMPKGVRIPHISVADTVQTMDKLFGLNEYDRVLGVSALTFDLSVFDLFGTLFAGAALVLLKDNRNLAMMEYMIEKHGVTFINAVPAVLKMLTEYIENTGKDFSGIQSIQIVILSGDVVPNKLVDKLLKFIPAVDLFISGGPTEITV